MPALITPCGFSTSTSVVIVLVDRLSPQLKNWVARIRSDKLTGSHPPYRQPDPGTLKLVETVCEDPLLEPFPSRIRNGYRAWIRTLNNTSKGRVITQGRANFAIRFSRRSPRLTRSNSSGDSRLTSDLLAGALFRRITNSPSGPQNPSRPTPRRKAPKRAWMQPTLEEYNTEIAISPKIRSFAHSSTDRSSTQNLAYMCNKQ
jgi:hypothetical protein